MSLYIDPEILIQEVESRPLLYAKNLAEYSNKALKLGAWEEIAERVSNDWHALSKAEKKQRGIEVQSKWQHLRDNFRRDFRTRRDGVSPRYKGLKRKRKYRYYDQLLFLLPYVQDSKPFGTSTPKVEKEEYIEQVSSPTNIEDASFDSDTTACSLLEIRQNSKRKIENTSCTVFGNESVAEQIDEDRAFCLSLVQSFKKMDENTKILVKIDILKILHSYLYKSGGSS